MELVQDPERVRIALSPVRREMLALLREPSTATEIAGHLDTTRQRVNYHLRALERAGLVDLVEERRKRGCIERVLVARAGAFVVDPSVMAEAGGYDSPDLQDTYAAEHLVRTASQTVREVARMRDDAERQGKRLLTFTVEAEVSLGEPADVERFAERLATLVAEAAQDFNTPRGGRRYRVVLGGHPAPRAPAAKSRPKKESS